MYKYPTINPYNLGNNSSQVTYYTNNACVEANTSYIKNNNVDLD